MVYTVFHTIEPGDLPVQMPLEQVTRGRGDVSIPAVPATIRADSRSTLDTLSLFDSETLEAVFASGERAALRELQGHPRGRVLAVPRVDSGWVAGVLRRLHASPVFPWEGKSFDAPAGTSAGIGINRVRGLRAGLFPFRTYESLSLVDQAPCIAIDYDVPGNPAVARPIYDEVRRVGDGLYLGRGMRRRPGRDPRLLLWFGLDARIQDPAVVFRRP